MAAKKRTTKKKACPAGMKRVRIKAHHGCVPVKKKRKAKK